MKVLLVFMNFGFPEHVPFLTKRLSPYFDCALSSFLFKWSFESTCIFFNSLKCAVSA